MKAKVLRAKIDYTLAEIEEMLKRREPTCDVSGCWNVATAFDTERIKFVCDRHRKRGGRRHAEP